MCTFLFCTFWTEHISNWALSSTICFFSLYSIQYNNLKKNKETDCTLIMEYFNLFSVLPFSLFVNLLCLCVCECACASSKLVAIFIESSWAGERITFQKKLKTLKTILLHAGSLKCKAGKTILYVLRGLRLTPRNNANTFKDFNNYVIKS